MLGAASAATQEGLREWLSMLLKTGLTCNAAMMTRLSQSLEFVRKGLETRSNFVADAIFEGEAFMFTALADAHLQDFPDKELADYSSSLCDLQDFSESVRVRAAEAAVKLASVSPKGPILENAVHDLIFRATSTERSHSVLTILRNSGKKS